MDADLAGVAVAATNNMKPRRILLYLPNEVIYNIAAYLLCSPSPSSTLPLGPPAALLPLLLTHTRLYFLLSPRHNQNLWIWRDAYCARFDEGAAVRRCAGDISSSTYEGDVLGHGAIRIPAARWLHQLVNNCKALRFFRKGHALDDWTRAAWPDSLTWFPPASTLSPPYNPIHQFPVVPREDNQEATPEQALMTALVMLLEDDGKNARQMIEWGQVRNWCLEAMEKRWVEENLKNTGPGDMDQGWAEENLRNSLVVSIFWMLCDQDTLPSIPAEKLRHICELLSPIVHNPYRYAASEHPPQHFHLPLPSLSSSTSSTVSAVPSTIPTTHGAYPPLPPHPSMRQLKLSHYGATTLLSIPLLSIPSKLLYFAISELLYPFSKPAETAKDRKAWLSKRDMKEFTRNNGGREMTQHEYMKEWRRRGEKRATKADVDEVNWSYFAKPPLGREPGSSRSSSFGPSSFIEDGDEEDHLEIKNLVHRNYTDKSIVRRWRGKAPFLSSPSSSISKSLSYEAEWWRLRLCSYGADLRILVDMGLDGGMERGAMKVRPGRVYEVGSMAGCWVGWMTIPREESIRTLLSATSLRHELVHRSSPVLDPVTGELVIDPSTGEPLQESLVVGVQRTPQDPAPQMPVVMKLWEGHLLTSMMDSVAGASSSLISTDTTTSSEDDQDPFWPLVDPSTNPSASKDNMLNAWFPGFPGTTKVTLASSEDPGNDELEAEIEIEGWDERKRKVRCKLWNGDDGEQELQGNDSLALLQEEGPLGSTLGSASPATSASTSPTHTPPMFSPSSSTQREECTFCFVHRVPVNEHTNTTVEGMWTGHGYTHLASIASTPSSHTITPTSTASATYECKECVARIKADRHLAHQRLREQNQKEKWKHSEKQKVWNKKMERVKEEQEERERLRLEEEQRWQDEQAERLFTSIGMGIGTSAADNDEVDEDFDEDEYSDEEDDNTTSKYSVPSTVSSDEDDGDRSESSFVETDYMFDPVPSYPSHHEEAQGGVQAPGQQHDEDDEFSGAEEYYHYQHPSIHPSIPLSKLGTAFGGEVETVAKEPTSATSRLVKPSSTSIRTSTRAIHSSTQGCSGIRSIMLFGTSGEERHGDAWGRYRFYGRVREWDGLIGLLRVPVRDRGPRFTNPNSLGGSSGATTMDSTATSLAKLSASSAHPYSRFLSNHIDARTVLLNGDLLNEEDDGDRNMILFYGYVGNGGESFVGNWRSVANGDVERPGNEGSFVLGRRRD